MGARTRTPVITLVVGVVVLGVLSLTLPSSATYDAWSWIIWGREVIHGELNTVSGPSWKPLPVVVTTLAAPLGSIAPDVWIVVARIGAISGVVLAYLIARRLGGIVAGVLAGFSLAAAPWWVWNGWLANSEGVLVAFVLGAVAAELSGRRRTALACGLAAGLLRPEAWPFVLAYAAWLAWRSDWRGRAAIAAGLAILPLAWLLPEKWGSGDYWRAASRAQNPDPGAASLTANPGWTVTGDFFTMLPTGTWAVVAAALVLAVLALVGRVRSGATAPSASSSSASTASTPSSAPAESPTSAASDDRPVRAILGIALLGVAWFLVVIVLTKRGFSGNERYLIPPVALILVAASAGFGLLLRRLPEFGRLALVAVFGIAMVVAAIQDVPEQMRRAVYESRLVDNLPRAIVAAGGAERINHCAPVATHKFMVPQVAWYLRRHLEDISMTPVGPDQVVMRLRLQENGGWTPTVRQIPDLSTWGATPYWQIVAHCGAGAGTGAAR